MKYVHFLDFETSLLDLEGQLSVLADRSSAEGVALQKKLDQQLEKIYSKLTPWQKVLVARHPERPSTKAYVEGLITDFFPISGDRAFGEDTALLAGVGRFQDRTVVVLGHCKGTETEERLANNFGMPHPEGYRKAVRAMDLADRFGFPVLCFIDTAGAFPGEEAEKRGQSQAIAACLEKSFALKVPIVSVVVGEGGSGGAVALGTSNVVLMLEHAVYSVISPEGCASILWRTRDKREEAATAQKLTAQDLLGFKMVETVVKEPLGGAHRNPDQAVALLKTALEHVFAAFPENPLAARRARFEALGRLG